MKVWEFNTTVSPEIALLSSKWFQPVIGNLESLRDKGVTYLTERNRHGEGYSAESLGYKLRDIQIHLDRGEERN